MRKIYFGFFVLYAALSVAALMSCTSSGEWCAGLFGVVAALCLWATTWKRAY